MKVSVLVSLVLAACGPGIAQQHTMERVVLADRDAAFYERLLAGPTVVAGLWFADAACQREFGTPQQVGADRAKELARCLATLHLRETARKDALPDVAVLTYDPGFEIEARVIDEGNGPRLTWIGWEARRDDSDNLPTISPAAFEALRTAGDPNGALAPEVTAALVKELPSDIPAAFAWFKVCLDATGNVTDVRRRMATSATAQQRFAAATAAWAFKPFSAGGTALPVCTMALMTTPTPERAKLDHLPFPAPEGPGVPLNVAPGMLRRLSGTITLVPDDTTKVEMTLASVDHVGGVFKYCLDTSGHVGSVAVLQATGFPAYDRRIVQGIQAWVFAPYLLDTGPAPVCSAATVLYTVTAPTVEGH